MNALPLPTGPMEIPGGASKTQRSSLKADKFGRADDGDSFASTLKGVHEGNRTKSDTRQTATCESNAGRDNNDADDLRPVKEEETVGGEEGAQAIPAPMKRDETAEGEEVPAGPAAEKHEDGVNAQAKNADNGGTRITVWAGVQSQESVQPKAMTTDNAQGTATAHKAAHDADVIPKAAAETIAQTPDDPSQQLPGPASSPPADAVNPAAGDPGSAEPMNQAAKDLQEKKMAQTVRPFLGDETGDEAPGTENSLATEGDDAGENGRLELDRGTKWLPSRADGREGEATRDVPKQKASAEPHVIPAERSSNGETPLRSLESASETGRETLTRIPNDANAQTVDRQVPNDTMLSITTAATANRTETVSPGTGAATTMAATEQFHQENFNQLVERAIFAVRGEQSEARIALKPDQLGHVQMQVVTEHHLVSIKIMTESPAARDLIDAHAHHLKAELQQQGLTVEHIEVSVSDDQGDAYRGERQREAFLRQLVSRKQSEPEEDISPLPSGLRQPLTGRIRSRGIDYFA